MIKRYLVFFLLIFVLLKPNSVYANPISDGATVSATILSSVLGPPILVTPTDGFSTNNARFSFVWQRPSPLPNTNLDHYDLYIDGAVYASTIPDSLTFQDFYFYTATGNSGEFTIALKNDLSQGYHTWKVVVFDDAAQSTSSSVRTFYIDSNAPFIAFTNLNSNTYTWTTADPTTIPVEASRHLVSNTSTPIIKGKVETNANLQISVQCPASPPYGCTNQLYVINSTDGNWEKQLTALIADVDYIIVLSATDATSNSTTFPTFYIKYSVTSATTTVTPTATVTSLPTASVTPSINVTPKISGLVTPLPTNATPTPTNVPLATISATLTPPPELAALITPTPFIPKVPPAPTLPPQKITKPKIAYAYGPYILFLFLCLGLPTHLIITGYGLSTSFNNIFRYLFTLGYPFLKNNNTITVPFTYIEVYDSNNLSKRPYRAFSDIKGNLYIPNNLPPQVLVKIINTNYIWLTQIIYSSILNSSCLLPLPKKQTNSKQTLQNNLYSLRSIPLIVAILTSSIGVFFFPSIYLIVYLYLSLQYSFSEYYYPKLIK